VVDSIMRPGCDRKPGSSVGTRESARLRQPDHSVLSIRTSFGNGDGNGNGNGERMVGLGLGLGLGHRLTDNTRLDLRGLRGLRGRQ